MGPVICDRCRAALRDCRQVARAGSLPLFALGAHDAELRRAIHAIKFRNRAAAAEALGELLGERLIAAGEFCTDVVVPVPLHPSRLRERGYNQSELIARGILTSLSRTRGSDPGVALEPSAVVRARATQPQTELGFAQRQKNVAGAFAAGPRAGSVLRRRVVLVDDVVTTSATMVACAKVLRTCGAAAVTAAALALRV